MKMTLKDYANNMKRKLVSKLQSHAVDLTTIVDKFIGFDIDSLSILTFI